MIYFYINNKSIHGQFNRAAFYTAFNAFLDAVSSIKKLTHKYQIVLCKSFFLSEAVNGENIATTIKSNRDLNLRYTSTFQAINRKYWNDNPNHKLTTQYFINRDDFVNTIVAEACEDNYTKKYPFGTLLNLKHSPLFTGLNVTVDRVENKISKLIKVDSISTTEEFTTWLKSKNISYPSLRKFESNPKHHVNQHATGVSSLDCTDDEAQKILDDAIAEEGVSNRKLFGFDRKRGKFVVFRKHDTDRFHGYNEDDHSKIPVSIKKHFRIS